MGSNPTSSATKCNVVLELEGLPFRLRRVIARLLYAKGNYAEVCATSIRAADAFQRCGLHTDAVAALVEAISALRPGRRGTELRQIIMRVRRICEQQSIREPSFRQEQ